MAEGEGPMLTVLGGLPGGGKTTLSRAIALRIGATHLRTDAIEQAIRSALLTDTTGTAGYAVAHAVAEANLVYGVLIVADGVNPGRTSREGWRSLAVRTGAPH